MLDFNIITGILVATGLILLVKIGLPFLKAKGMKGNIYEDMKLALMLFGYAFRDEKVKDITSKIYNIVAAIEKLDIAPIEKKNEAVEIAFKELMDELNIMLDKEALELIINIAVAYLPATN